MNSLIYFLSLATLFILAMSGCGSRLETGDDGIVIQTADGRFLAADCLQRYGLTAQAKSTCEVRVERSADGGSRGVRASYSYDSGYSYYSPSVVYPPNYTQDFFASYFNWDLSGLYAYFGYPSYGSVFGSGYGYGYGYDYSWLSDYGNSPSYNYDYSTPFSYSSCNDCLYDPYSSSCRSSSSWACVYPLPQYPSYPTSPTQPTTPPTPQPQPPVTTPSQVQVPCVGGPNKPSYAFYDRGWANQCAQKIASFGSDCRQYVQVRYCLAHVSTIGTTFPQNCVCNPKSSAVGTWVQ